MGNVAAAQADGSLRRPMCSSYDNSRSTEDNYSTDKAVYVGKFADIRKCLDYSYHKHYTTERQLFQDKIMQLFDASSPKLETTPKGSTIHKRNSFSRDKCDDPVQRWLLFTAGAMGAGKTHTLLWLSRRDIFPLETFVRVDPDALRDLLPETRKYQALDQETAAQMTQKEVGYMAEILTMYALRQNKNVLVDGSLRNYEWYQQYITAIREDYPSFNIGILHVLAPESTVLSRCRSREAVTGRHVPEEVVRESMAQLRVAIHALAPFVDCVVTFENDTHPPGSQEGPVLIESPAKALCDGHDGIPPSLVASPLTVDEFSDMFRQTRQGLDPHLDLSRSNSLSSFSPLRKGMATAGLSHLSSFTQPKAPIGDM